MTDKDQFNFDDDTDNFDDDTDFLENDLSTAFSEGEFEADSPAKAPGDNPDAEQDAHGDRTDGSSGSGGSRTRTLLLVLLLVVVGAAGVSYFMGLDEVTPTVPTAPPAAKTTQKTVALPPQPTAAPVAEATPPSPPEPSVTVAVPPPQPAQATAPPVTGDAARPAQVEPAVGADPAESPPADPVAVEKPVQAVETVAAPAAPAPSQGATQGPAHAKPSPPAAPAVLPQQAAEGLFALDAGSYLFESNRDALIAKIQTLGYDPLVTPVEAKLNMTRLRVGTYRKEEVKKALDFARSIEPGSYSAPAGDGYVIYAGTFLKKETVEKLTRRFHAEGLKVYAEPIEVVRTLSRIRFGRFATRADAVKAAEVAGQAGVRSDIVKAR